MSFNCPECGHRIEDGIIEMVFDLKNTHVAVSNVPAKVCPNCGQEFVDGFVAENVNRLVDRVIEDVESYAKKEYGPNTYASLSLRRTKEILDIV